MSAESEEGPDFAPRFSSDGLLTCVTVDADDGVVLMVAHMNAEALEKTLASGIVHAASTETVLRSYPRELKDAYGGYYTLGRTFVQAIGHPEVGFVLMNDERVVHQLPPAAKAMLADVLSCSAVGSRETVRKALLAFIERTRPDELMITSQIFDHAARLHSYEIAADIRENL